MNRESLIGFTVLRVARVKDDWVDNKCFQKLIFFEYMLCRYFSHSVGCLLFCWLFPLLYNSFSLVIVPLVSFSFFILVYFYFCCLCQKQKSLPKLFRVIYLSFLLGILQSQVLCETVSSRSMIQLFFSSKVIQLISIIIFLLLCFFVEFSVVYV